MSTYPTILAEIERHHAKLVAVSKTKPVALLREFYDQGQRRFGENRVQELVDKSSQLPEDVEWHFIGHLQRNKVKYIAPIVHLIHGVDSPRLLEEINKRAAQHDRVISCLLQFHIAEEATKHGMDLEEAEALLSSESYRSLQHVQIHGVMGMATYTDDEHQVRKEFRHLKKIFITLKTKYFASSSVFNELSMGMSGDYKIALAEGSTMVRIGSLLFGTR